MEGRLSTWVNEGTGWCVLGGAGGRRHVEAVAEQLLESHPQVDRLGHVRRLEPGAVRAEVEARIRRRARPLVAHPAPPVLLQDATPLDPADPARDRDRSASERPLAVVRD